jgi:excisionase family DNA binding protein
MRRLPARLHVGRLEIAMLAMPAASAADRTKDLLTAQQIAYRLSISVRTVWRMLERQELPQPIRYNRKLVRWRVTDIDQYVAGLK